VALKYSQEPAQAAAAATTSADATVPKFLSAANVASAARDQPKGMARDLS
jgi:hypothetical protein